MPGNEIEGRIHKLYELDNYSRQSQVADCNWPVLYNLWHEKQRESSEPQSFNLKSNVQQLDSVRGHGYESSTFDKNCTQLAQRPGFSNIQTRNQYLKANGSMLERQDFQERQNQLEFLGESTVLVPHHLNSRSLSIFQSDQENASGDSPTLTTNSERSEITEASSEFNFVGRQQQLVRGRQQDIPQLHLMQQSGYNDMQLLQQHMMYKKLQELQRQQQPQQFGDARQQTAMNQLSAINKQAAGVQFSPLINGTPLNDTPQRFMNWVQRGGYPAGQNVSNRIIFSQEQGQTLSSMGLAPQQFDVSLYGTPVASGRGTMNQYSHLQAISHDSENLLTKGSGQTQNPAMQSSAFSNPFVGDHHTTASPDQACLPQGAFISKQGFQGKNVFGQVPMQGLNCGSTLGNLQQGNTLQTNTSLQELSGKQDQAGWPGTFQEKTMQHGPSQGLVPLDPMEEKILFNTDDNFWDASMLQRSDIGVGRFGNAFEHTGYSDAFPSLQSGSWSALMQSAVAEASSSDTGPQEEWSGLTFQNTELSTGNQPSSILDSEKQQGSWADNNLQSASSLCSKPFPMLNDSSVNSSFPGFPQPGIQFPTEHREGPHQDECHESIQKSPKNASEWLDRNHQQKLSVERSQQVQPHLRSDNTWASKINEHSECDSHQQRIDSYGVVGQPSGNPEGDTNEAMDKKNSDGSLWRRDGDCRVTSFSRSTGQLEQVQSGSEDTLRNRENSHVFNFHALPNSHITKVHQETSHPDNNKLDYMKRMIFSNNEKNEGISEKQNPTSYSSHVIRNSYGREGETYEQQQNCYQSDNSYDSKPIDTSATVCRSGDLSGMHATAGTSSQNMFHLLSKVDQSKENSSIAQFSPSGFNPLSEVKTPGASVAHMYNQSYASQGFALKLTPPSQRQSNSSTLFSSQSMRPASNPNQMQMDSDLGKKNQTRLPIPSSSQSLPQSHESSPRARWDDKFGIQGQSSIPSSHMHGSSIAEITSSPTFPRNQLQKQPLFNVPGADPSTQATLPGTATRHPPSNLAYSQDTSQQFFINPGDQQFPALESVPVSQSPFLSGMPARGGASVRPHSQWTYNPSQQHLSRVEPQKVPSVVHDSMETTSLTSKELNNLSTQEGGYRSSEFGTSSMNLQGFISSEEQQGKEGAQKPMSSGVPDASQTGVGKEGAQKPMPSAVPDASQKGVRNVSDPRALASGSLLTRLYLQDLDRIHHGDNSGLAPSARNLGFFGHASKPSHGFHQNYSPLHQLQAMVNAETEPRGRDLDEQQVTAVAGQQSTYSHNKDDELSSAPALKSSPHGNSKVPSFLTDAREDPSVKNSSQSAFQAQGVVAFGESDSQSQSTGNNVFSNHSNLRMASNWFKQYGTFRNGQMPMDDARLGRTATGQFSLVKPSQSLNIHSSVEQIDATDASQSNRVWPSTAANLVASEPFIPPYVLPSDAIDESMVIERPKKRKIATPVLLPWHKVTQGSKGVQDISMAAQDWALASNRLMEKFGDEIEMIEDGHPILRSKRRLIFTTHLLQHLLGPAPASILSADAALYYDSVIYFFSKLSLGDACSLSCSRRNSTHMAPNDSNMVSEKLQVSESIDDQYFSKVVLDFTNRSKKLEDDLLRLDRTAPILDVRLECQELERFSVINRFARFHAPRADMSGISSPGTVPTALRPCPQRYVTGQPLPRNLPEGVPCLSL